MNGKVYYVGFYVDERVKEKLAYFPSSIPKMNYIIETIKKNGYEIEVVSLCMAKNKFKKEIISEDAQERHKYFSSSGYGLRKIKRAIFEIKVLFYLLFHVKKEDKVIVYHSLSSKIWLKLFLKFFKNSCIVEIEELYSYVNCGWKKYLHKEIKLVNTFKYAICVNERISSSLTSAHKSILSYGSYVLPKYNKKNTSDGIINLVYAGVIETNRKAAFLSVEAMKFLPQNYRLHILGFGKDEDINTLVTNIESLNLLKSDCCQYHGAMHGEEYYAFLQSCDIGLSTHQYFQSDMESANYSFPSKVLTYMANGLRVVAQKIECLLNSEIGSSIVYYDLPTPEAIAKAIMQVDLNDGYNGREIISKLDEKFTKEIAELINEVGK